MFPQLQQNQIVVGGQYQIIRFISKGTGGHVYEALDRRSNLRVALKIQQNISDHEYQSLCALYEKRPFQHITNILSFNSPNQFFQFFAIGMDLAEGSFVQYWEANQSQLSEAQILNYFLQIAQGLDEIHSKVGLIHRDMKLENVVYNKKNGDIILKICDTGLMRNNQNDLRKTNMIGTPYYMPPEQINKEIYNEKVDIWSLGVILFEMTSKTKMVDDPDYKILLNKITLLQQFQIDKIIDDQQKISFEIKKLIKKMIVVKPEHRLSAKNVVFEVQKLINQNFQPMNTVNQAIQFPRQFGVNPQKQFQSQPINNQMKQINQTQILSPQQLISLKNPQQQQLISAQREQQISNNQQQFQQIQQSQPIQFQQRITQDNQFQQQFKKEENSISYKQEDQKLRQEENEKEQLQEEEEIQLANDQKINQKLEEQKRQIEEQLSKDKQKEMEIQLKKIEDEEKNKMLQIEVEEKIAFQKELEKQIELRRKQLDSDSKQFLSELQEALQQKLEQIQYDTQISNAQKQQEMTQIQQEFDQQMTLKNQQYTEQLKDLQMDVEKDLKCKSDEEKEKKFEEQKKQIEDKISQQFQNTFEKQYQLLFRIFKFKGENIQDLNQSQELIFMEIKKIEQLQYQNKENQVFFDGLNEQLKIFDQMINQRLDELQKIQTLEQIEQFEKSKYEYPQIQYKNLKAIIELHQIQANKHQQENQEKIKQISQECQQIQANNNSLINNFIQELMEFPLPNQGKIKFDEFLNENQNNKVQLNQIMQYSQIQSEASLNEFKQKLQKLNQNLNDYTQNINEEMINQLEYEKEDLLKDCNNLKMLIQSILTGGEEQLEQFSIVSETLKQQNLKQLKISQVIELYEQFSNLKTFIAYCSAQFQFFLNFSKYQLSWLSVNIVEERSQYLIQLQNVLLEYSLNFQQKSHYKQVNQFISQLQQITFQKFFLELLRKIKVNLNNKELQNFQDFYKQVDFIKFQNEIKSTIKSIQEPTHLQNLEQEVKKWTEELEQYQKDQGLDEVQNQIQQELIKQINLKKQQVDSYTKHIQELSNFKFQQSKYEEIINELFNNLQKQQEFILQANSLEQDLINLSKDQLDDTIEDRIFQCFSNKQVLPPNELISLKQLAEEEFDILQIVAILHLVFKLKGYSERYNSNFQRQLNQSQNQEKSNTLQNFTKYLEQASELIKQKQLSDIFKEKNQFSLIQQFKQLIELNLLQFESQQQQQFFKELDMLNDGFWKLYILLQKIYEIIKTKIFRLNQIKIKSKLQYPELIKCKIQEDFINTFEIYKIQASYQNQKF